jgi:hypothetical protein
MSRTEVQLLFVSMIVVGVVEESADLTELWMSQAHRRALRLVADFGKPVCGILLLKLTLTFRRDFTRVRSV